MDNPHFKASLERATNSTMTIEMKQEQIQKHTEELSQLYSLRREWEDNVTVGLIVRLKVSTIAYSFVYSFVECRHPGYSGAQSYACQA